MTTTHVPDAGFRMTPQRQAVLDALRTSHDHPTAEDIHGRVRATSPGIGVATVYRTLDLLVRHGTVSELRLGDDAATRYDANVQRHDHVVCRGCGTVRDVIVRLPRRVVTTAEEQSDLEIDAYDLEFRGLCAACRDDG